MSRTVKRRNRNCQGVSILGQLERTLLGVLGIALVIAAGWGGYELGLRDTDTTSSRVLAELETLFDAERRFLASEKRGTGEHLDALARKMGEMQSRILHLEALGERLVERGDLNRDEFDFSELPAMGGPASATGLSTTLPEMVDELDALARRIEDRSLKLDLLEDLLIHRQISEDTRPAGRPVDAGWISSRYGWRTDPFSGKKTLHRGLDFAGKKGTAIIAVADGVVSWAGNRSGFGKTVEIRHGNGYVTRYAHNSDLKVQAGDLVRQGQEIAAMGKSGRATGTHLHFEVIRDGRTVDPLKFVKAARKTAAKG
jgi:murein DD-endopeptidase MepM/ murein hydrolase activator NlpD